MTEPACDVVSRLTFDKDLLRWPGDEPPAVRVADTERICGRAAGAIRGR